MVKCNDSCFYNRFLLFNILITAVVFYIHSSSLTQVERYVSYTAIYTYFMTLKWAVFEQIQWKYSLVNGIVLLCPRLPVNTAHLRLVSDCNGHIRWSYSESTDSCIYWTGLTFVLLIKNDESFIKKLRFLHYCTWKTVWKRKYKSATRCLANKHRHNHWKKEIFS